ncbi:OLC1v1006318C1 [Oldenlandia corymbosa var. corymbosa]|uniref:glucan endo-1,3-beta-D-glucosidase n=1 Tax=Oldenlandia corymbosa var. corymbosa TaxID=529605 RepID=A0AAV1DIU8_OLDCO|nr:OLC1v1006318C1 [Oldenlandia corymbosa var. corymbosa]
MASTNLHFLLKWFMLLALFSWVHFPSRALAIGVNWGRMASHPLPPAQVVQLLKANKVTKVRLFDADPDVLESLGGSDIGVIVGVPNTMLRSLNSSLKAAENWVHDNLTRYVSAGASSAVQIEYISVGDDSFLQSYGKQFYPFVVGAAANLRTALIKVELAEKIKIVIPCSYDAFLSESGLPSGGQFRTDINKTMSEVLTFLSKHRSPFFVTISPFLSFHQTKNISLDLALFKQTARPRNDSGKSYRNGFNLSYDTLVMALSSAGFPHLDVIIGQIGWPTDGAANATSSIAQDFIRGLLGHLDRSGTPLRPQTPPLETYIFSLLDEDQKSTVAGNFERHWGIFTFDGQAKYQVDLSHGSNRLVNAQNVQYLSSKWCVVNNNKGMSNLTAQASQACSTADCSALSLGGSCYNLSWPANVSYAFNSYYQQHDQRADSCAFGGLGLITTVDPSVGSCRFPIGLRSSLSAPVDRSTMFHLFISQVVTIAILSCLMRETW